MEKLKNTNRMLIDIYASNVSGLPIIKNIYHEINKNPTKDFPAITTKDNQMLIYVALMYDKFSPIRKETLVNKKVIAFEQAGVKQKTIADDWSKLGDKRLIMLIHYYLKYQNDKQWASLCTMNDLFWELQLTMADTNVLTAEDPLKQLQLKAKLREEFQATISSIDQYEEIIFGDNKDQKDVIINFSPEDFTELLEEMERQRADV